MLWFSALVLWSSTNEHVYVSQLVDTVSPYVTLLFGLSKKNANCPISS